MSSAQHFGMVIGKKQKLLLQSCKLKHRMISSNSAAQYPDGVESLLHAHALSFISNGGHSIAIVCALPMSFLNSTMRILLGYSSATWPAISSLLLLRTRFALPALRCYLSFVLRPKKEPAQALAPVHSDSCNRRWDFAWKIFALPARSSSNVFHPHESLPRILFQTSTALKANLNLPLSKLDASFSFYGVTARACLCSSHFHCDCSCCSSTSFEIVFPN